MYVFSHLYVSYHISKYVHVHVKFSLVFLKARWVTGNSTGATDKNLARVLTLAPCAQTGKV